MPSRHLLRRLATLTVALSTLGSAAAAHAATPMSRMTGLDPAQVTTEHSCATAAPGHARCEAEVLVMRANDQVVHPRTAGGRVAHLTGYVASSSAPQSAPQPGTAAYLQQAYDLSYLSATKGVGDTVGVIDAYDDPSAEADLATFRWTNGLPACTTANGCFHKVNQSGGAAPLPAADSGWETEIALDLAAVSALCPNCHILLVEANSSSSLDLVSAMHTAQSLGARQISDSWSVSAAGVPFSNFSFPGAAVIAATGDDGTLAPGTDSYPAALPGVTAAGGTTLNPAGGPRGFAESAWSGAGSGCDTYEPKPAYQAAGGCNGRSYSDISAVADPNTGLGVYDSGSGGWILAGGTSLAAPLVAAYEAVTGVQGTTPQWAYTDSGALNDPASGSNGACSAILSIICDAGLGYDGPTGAGSISGAVTSGAPGIGGAPHASASGNDYVQSVTATSASMVGGVYPNGNDTTYYWQYGPTTAYGQQTAPVDIGSGSAPVAITSTLSKLSPSSTYHYRLVASNSAGTTYGYDYTVDTAAGANSTPTSGHATRAGAPDRGKATRKKAVTHHKKHKHHKRHRAASHR
jgi:subtilase family serine protease